MDRHRQEGSMSMRVYAAQRELHDELRKGSEHFWAVYFQRIIQKLTELCEELKDAKLRATALNEFIAYIERHLEAGELPSYEPLLQMSKHWGPVAKMMPSHRKANGPSPSPSADGSKHTDDSDSEKTEDLSESEDKRVIPHDSTTEYEGKNESPRLGGRKPAASRKYEWASQQGVAGQFYNAGEKRVTPRGDVWSTRRIVSESTISSSDDGRAPSDEAWKISSSDSGEGSGDDQEYRPSDDGEIEDDALNDKKKKRKRENDALEQARRDRRRKAKQVQAEVARGQKATRIKRLKREKAEKKNREQLMQSAKVRIAGLATINTDSAVQAAAADKSIVSAAEEGPKISTRNKEPIKFQETSTPCRLCLEKGQPCMKPLSGRTPSCQGCRSSKRKCVPAGPVWSDADSRAIDRFLLAVLRDTEPNDDEEIGIAGAGDNGRAGDLKYGKLLEGMSPGLPALVREVSCLKYLGYGAKESMKEIGATVESHIDQLAELQGFQADANESLDRILNHLTNAVSTGIG